MTFPCIPCICSSPGTQDCNTCPQQPKALNEQNGTIQIVTTYPKYQCVNHSDTYLYIGDLAPDEQAVVQLFVLKLRSARNEILREAIDELRKNLAPKEAK